MKSHPIETYDMKYERKKASSDFLKMNYENFNGKNVTISEGYTPSMKYKNFFVLARIFQ